MSKIKVGDRVRYVGGCHVWRSAGIPVGSEFIVGRISQFHGYTYIYPDKDYPEYHLSNFSNTDEEYFEVVAVSVAPNCVPSKYPTECKCDIWQHGCICGAIKPYEVR